MNWLKVARILFRINVLIAVLIILILIAMSKLAHARPQLTNGNKKVEIRVMVIDTGIDDSNPWLIGRIDHTAFPKEFKNLEGIDQIGHGTHVSGIILWGGFKMEDGYAFPIPINPVCSNVKIISCKYYDPPSYTNLQNTVYCLRLAKFLKVDYVNYSSGGSEPSEKELQALEDLRSENIPVFIAAGNESQDLKKKAYYPASYGLPNETVVGNVNKDGKLMSSSNYGGNTVYEVGEDVMSTLPGDTMRMGKMTGTSQSAPKALNRILVDLCRYM